MRSSVIYATPTVISAFPILSPNAQNLVTRYSHCSFPFFAADSAAPAVTLVALTIKHFAPAMSTPDQVISSDISVIVTTHPVNFSASSSVANATDVHVSAL